MLENNDILNVKGGLMKKRYLLLLLIALVVFAIVPKNTSASSTYRTYEEEFPDYVTISENTKYYKTIYTYHFDLMADVSTINRSVETVTYEVSQEEYENASTENNIILSNPTAVETVYKRMTASITTNGSNYRYKNVLQWKIMPSLRSYDIIGIGFLGNVEPATIPYFRQDYCFSSNNCSVLTLHTPQVFNYGAGTSFKLVEGELASLKETLYFDVKKKNANSTIYSQYAYGDYAHATSTINMINATNYQVIQAAGLALNTSISSYYDTLEVADASWFGTW